MFDLSHPVDDPSPAEGARSTRVGIAVGAGVMVVASLLLLVHRYPLFGPETDFVARYVVEAQSIASGKLVAGGYHGPMFPAMVAGLHRLVSLPLFVSAQIVSVLASGVVAGVTYKTAEGVVGKGTGGYAVATLLSSVLFIRYAHTASTEMLFLAECAIVAHLVLGQALIGIWRGVGIGLTCAIASLTRTNGIFLLIAVIPIIVGGRGSRRSRLQSATATLLSALLPLALVVTILGPSYLGENNHTNLAFAVHGAGDWEGFWDPSTGRHPNVSDFGSTWDVLSYDPIAVVTKISMGLITNPLQDLHRVGGVHLVVLVIAGVVHAARNSERNLIQVVWMWSAFHILMAVAFYSPRLFLFSVLRMSLLGARGYLVLKEWLSRRAGWLVSPFDLTLVGAGVAVVVLTHSADLSASSAEIARFASQVRASDSIPGVRSIVARKPHIAYFLGLKHLPMPMTTSLSELRAVMCEREVPVLYVGEFERRLRPELAQALEVGDHRFFSTLAKSTSQALYKCQCDGVTQNPAQPTRVPKNP